LDSRTHGKIDHSSGNGKGMANLMIETGVQQKVSAETNTMMFCQCLFVVHLAQEKRDEVW